MTADLHPVLRRVYACRGVQNDEELDLGLGRLLPVERMDVAFEAARLLFQAMREQRRILIIGDFDCDGATSTALSVLALRGMGAEQVDYLVPNRFEYGYGLTPEIVGLAASAYAPDLILTVDNGVSSVDGVAAANRLGIQVVVTDHHLPGPVLPDAAAMVNPNLPDNGFPAKSTAGVGVVFYVLLALRSLLRERGWFDERSEPNMGDHLDLLALGTVADVVPLERNNRILVHQGLARIRAGRCRPGITALLEVAGRNPRRAQASDLGFTVGPRLNAAGRLDDMSLGIECLLTEDPGRARELAAELDQLNRDRRHIEDDMRQQAETLLETVMLKESDLPWGLCLYDDSWHQGVIGIVASRIKERHHRSVIAFAPGDDGEIKGSARSIPGVHIRDVLDEVAAGSPGLLLKFGGHAMAAGLTLETHRLDEFKELFNAVLHRRLDKDAFEAVIESDGEIAAEDMNLDLAYLVEQGGPWGQGFPEPVFHGEFEVIQQRQLQDKHWKLVVRPPGSNQVFDAIGFNLVRACPSPLPQRLLMAYQLDVNEFRGSINLQLRIAHMEAV
ncbi:single-stranded-DNA-specific exonuclease RecJ [Thiolapillus sp.]|uniref:single-stranded-DNA-specific exonuclease RecJ n=1 Tax=Thiolapillus sp. TaxID=2017437 RepID=UPI0027E5B2F6|nr:single-stranded-DNA-specific exonuclease RecJ [Thiolapillus sp.]